MAKENQSGISIQTLVISAGAAVAAAIIVPLFWERGTLIATAMTPVIVAVVSEALRKPVEVIRAATPVPTRRSATGAAVRDPEFDPLPPDERDAAPEMRSEDPYGLRAKPRVHHHWKIALATGAIACVVAVVALTASELVLGGPATRDSGRTTIFGGSRTATPTPSPTPTATGTEEEEATPAPSESPEPTTTASPTPTASPSPQPRTAPAPTPTPTP
jgi:hypothetical protein